MKNHLLLSLTLITLLACHRPNKGDNGDLNNFKEVNLVDLTPDNPPEGLEFRDNAWRSAKGWEMVHSKDGQRVMMLQDGSDKGSVGFECKCNSGSGSCGVSKEIVMCVADACTDCKTVLKIYNSRITIKRAEW